VHEGFLWGNLRDEGHLGDGDVDGKIILKCILETLDMGMEWLDLAQDSVRWRVLVIAVMNFRVP
jgi:hypothetical protein